MGQEWLGTWCGGDRDRNPLGKAALILLKAFDDLQLYIVLTVRF
jgi:phosphoenolpyruvate carboxylase